MRFELNRFGLFPDLKNRIWALKLHYCPASRKNYQYINYAFAVCKYANCTPEMEINLELPSGRDERLNATDDINNDDNEENVVDNEIMGDEDGTNKSMINNYMPQNGMEFETKELAYSFYREYARSVGFGITIKASRRSKKSGSFIDIKIACSRFGTNRHSSTAITTPRPCPKTDCKASVHIKKRPDGKWFIYSFENEHNHEICPNDFYNSLRGKNKQILVLDCQKKRLLSERDVQLLLDYFTLMQAESPGFYYVLDFAKEGYMRNIFWVDTKGRNDYISFSDVVFFDIHYVRSKYNIPFVPIIGVNNHSQFTLLGCALIGDEKPSTFLWLMRTWLRAVGGQIPKVVITDNDKSLIEAKDEVFPDALHCFCPWHVFRDIRSNFSHKLSEYETFLQKFRKCVNRSWTNAEFENRWQKMVNKFDLADDSWIRTLYEDRRKWVLTYTRDIFLGGFCTVERSQSIASFFDKYLQKETTIEDFIGICKQLFHERFEEEARVDTETLTCGSPFEKQVSKIYTRAIFIKFQGEVSKIHACNVVKEGEDEKTVLFRVDDLEIKQNFTVVWNRENYDIRCLCHLFEYSGFLCRHTLSVFQLCGISTIPSKYILKRWTPEAKIKDISHRALNNMNLRVHRLDDLCKLAVKVSEEGSLSKEVYEVAYHALEEALKHCVGMNISNGESSNIVTASKIKEVAKKRKVRAEDETLSNGIRIQEGVEHLNQRSVSLHDSYISRQHLQGMEIGSRIHVNNGYYVGSNLFPSMRDCYYNDQPTSQGNMLQGQSSFTASSLAGCFHTRDSVNNLEP